MKTKLIGLGCLMMICFQVNVKANGSGRAKAVASEDVNAKLIKAFESAFPKAQAVDWSETRDYYFVHFKEDSRENTANMEIEYDHDGNFIESERYSSDPSMLPVHLAWEINKKYKGKSIFGITEVNNDEGTVYFVKLQDAKEWITVSGDSQGIEGVTERFNKQ